MSGADAERGCCALAGELDIATADETWRASLAALDALGPDLTVDLSAVTFLDCAGVAPLVRLARESRARGGAVLFTGSTRPVRRVLVFAGLSPGLHPADGQG